ncbi:kinesin-like protein KIF12 isoform X2 [Ambystoma mexicanum]|uniref:kinesin-like protein KIF12 isoform X2 n=1 Tax=Ambystoma mexicanum TaxID=8296 RepID=UPI0037E9413A
MAFFNHLNSLEDPSEADVIKDKNISVAVRVRPLTNTEIQRGEKAVVYCPGEGAVFVSHAGQEKIFRFDSVFDSSTSQQELFEESGVKRLIELALSGYSCTVFAFGQTGSGKTYSLTGPQTMFEEHLMTQSLAGLMQRSFLYLLEQCQAHASEFTLSASYMEIYNEQVRDLLSPRLCHSLPVRWNKTRGFYVESLFTVEFESLDTIMALLQEGMRNRQNSAHRLNESSSRSHALLTIGIRSEAPDPLNSSCFLTKHGKLCFVDLAGSEKVKHTGSTGELMVEANSINRSLLALGHCISLLVESKKKPSHIPYRDSNLTRLLADSLGGSGVTLMVACISPSSRCLPETMYTLRYANRAKRIKNRPMAHMDPKERLLCNLEEEIQCLKAENVFLRQQLPLVGIQHSGSINGKETSSHQKLPQRHSESRAGGLVAHPRCASPAPEEGLYGILQEFLSENEKLRRENLVLMSSRDRAKHATRALCHENDQLVRKLEELERVLSSSPTVSSRSFSGRSQSLRISTPTSSGHSLPKSNHIPVTDLVPLLPDLPALEMFTGDHNARPEHNDVDQTQSPRTHRSAPNRCQQQQPPHKRNGLGKSRSCTDQSQLLTDAKGRPADPVVAARTQERVLPSAPPLPEIDSSVSRGGVHTDVKGPSRAARQEERSDPARDQLQHYHRLQRTRTAPLQHTSRNYGSSNRTQGRERPKPRA